MTIFDVMALHVLPGAVAFDVGANKGDCAALMAKIGARVIAFEPNPAMFFKARERGGEDLIVRDEALSDSIGSAVFYIDKREGAFASSLLVLNDLGNL